MTEFWFRLIFSLTGITILYWLIHFLLHALVHFSYSSARLAKLLGLSISLAGAVLANIFWNELKEIPAEPAPMSVKEAVSKLAQEDHVWVSLTDGMWDCQNMGQDDTGTLVVVVDPEAAAVIVASFEGTQTCRQLGHIAPKGRLAKLDQRRYYVLSNYIDFSQYPESKAFYGLCTYCGARNSRLGVIMGLVFVVLGMLFPWATSSSKAKHSMLFETHGSQT